MKIYYALGENTLTNIFLHSDFELKPYGECDLDLTVSEKNNIRNLTHYVSALPGVNSISIERYGMIIEPGLLFDRARIFNDIRALITRLYGDIKFVEITHSNFSKLLGLESNTPTNMELLPFLHTMGDA